MQVISKESINTNNGWGFGGYTGTLTSYDNNLIYREAKQHYRHAPSTSANQWFVKIDADFKIPIDGRVPSEGTVYVYENDDNFRAFFFEPTVKDFPSYLDKDNWVLYQKISFSKN